MDVAIFFDGLLIREIFQSVNRRSPASAEDSVYTDCWAELWANKPHPLCDNPVLIAYAAIPLCDHDVAGIIIHDITVM